jgi:endonuclease/exonuclease/phosphatase family metal-dependent hydrolase
VAAYSAAGNERIAAVTVVGGELEKRIEVKQLAAGQSIIELGAPVENTVFDLRATASVIFQWRVAGSIPDGCKVLLSPSPGMTPAVEFLAVTAYVSSLAIASATLDDLLEAWNIAPGEEATVYWTVAAQAGQENASAEPPYKAIKLKRIPVTRVVRVMSYNIYAAEGLDGKAGDYPRLANIITGAAPDVVALQEVDSVNTRSKQVDVLLRLATLTSMRHVYCASINLGGGKYGIGILSKAQPLSWKRVPLPGTEEARSLLVVEFEDYVFCCTHFSLTAADRLASVSLVEQAVSGYDKPVFLAGDLNDVPASQMLTAFKQHWEVLSNPAQRTHPADNPTTTLDYILGYAAKGQVYEVVQTQVLNEPVASDHRPLFADVRIVVNNE